MMNRRYGEINVPWISLTPQGIHWIGARSSDRLPTHRQQSNDQRQHPTQNEKPDTQINAIGEVVEPAAHRVISDRPEDLPEQRA